MPQENPPTKHNPADFWVMLTTKDPGNCDPFQGCLEEWMSRTLAKALAKCASL